PMLTEFFEQLGTEHHIPVFPSLAALNVNHHTLAVDAADLQVCQFGTAQTGGVEGHEQRAVKGSAGRLDQSRDFFLTEDYGQTMIFFRIGSIGEAPALLERLAVKKP